MTEIRKIDDKVSEITIVSGEYSVSVFTYGAILHRFCHKDRDILLGYEDYVPYMTAPGHVAKIVGPFANRIAKGEFSMDGRRYVLEKNNGPNNLHSGSTNGYGLGYVHPGERARGERYNVAVVGCFMRLLQG